ncbi:hypothetical protein [Paenibacillus contaminans]|nr:hypothetical protein [Paenibacillus contaminans]
MIQAAIIGLGKIGLLFDIPLKAVPQSHALAYHLHPEIDLIPPSAFDRSKGSTWRPSPLRPDFTWT